MAEQVHALELVSAVHALARLVGTLGLESAWAAHDTLVVAAPEASRLQQASVVPAQVHEAVPRVAAVHRPAVAVLLAPEVWALPALEVWALPAFAVSAVLALVAWVLLALAA